MNYKIIAKGTASTDYPFPAKLDGIYDNGEDFSDYFYDGHEIANLKGVVSGGTMYFKFIDNKLWTYTEYVANRQLNNRELHVLLDYTVGQWSDGIGEGFEQFPCAIFEKEEVYISPWHPKQIRKIYQEEILEVK